MKWICPQVSMAMKAVISRLVLSSHNAGAATLREGRDWTLCRSRPNLNSTLVKQIAKQDIVSVQGIASLNVCFARGFAGVGRCVEDAKTEPRGVGIKEMKVVWLREERGCSWWIGLLEIPPTRL